MKRVLQRFYVLLLSAVLVSVPGMFAAQPVGAQSLYDLLRTRTKVCWQTGNCQLDDILLTGVAFANLLIGLSAAAFFATFIYGGVLYLISFGSKDTVGKGKKALTGAAIGMVIVMSAWTIVNYLALSLTGKAI